MGNREYKHFQAKEFFEMVVNYGGPDLWDEYKSTFVHTCSQKLYFPDWYVINEFYTYSWALWWGKVAEIVHIQPGDSIYLDL